VTANPDNGTSTRFIMAKDMFKTRCNIKIKGVIRIKSEKLFLLIVKALLVFFAILGIMIISNITYAQDISWQRNPAKLNSQLTTDVRSIYTFADFKAVTNQSETTIADNPGSNLKKKQNTSQSLRKFLYNLIRKRGNPSVEFYMVVFFIALILGALHALTPGHGKTIVAAYLVGSKGTTKHAIILGAIVTLTHTGSVILLTILTLVATHFSHFFLSLLAASLLEIFSGAIILVLGIYLLIVRLRKLHFGGDHTSEYAHHHDHHYEHGDHDHHHHHELNLGENDEHYHRHEHDNNHNHHGLMRIKQNIREFTHTLMHHYDNHHHDFSDTDVNFKSLLTLGLSGGIVPCPDAIAILFLAISIKRIFLGLAIMLSFSLGLAIVLTLIGLTMVHSRKLFSRFDQFDKFTPLISTISAVIVVILGCILTFNAIAKFTLN
jgi:nickel/cobalt transporter (NicO) family protein